ncbi:MAG: NADH-quinone oxidoreductase subunit NuoG [Gammaproteobacteria bacterium]|nr:NADH-quinone oxidoreductase subunit NuoG [Gammaproteobacteria bacterium]
MSEDLVTIHIDGRELKARRGTMLIEVADEAGIHIPRFCYHKKLSVAANCRMCLVEVEKAPKPLPACATPVNDGMTVHTRSEEALRSQRSVMEFLLINHPLDCPICDQGGECELQDVAMGYGGDVSRFSERKRVVPDKDLGPLIATDMTRCIHCTRCVRFGEEIAGIRELGVTGRGEDLRIGTFIERSMDSEMSGNVIDLCPVGALTNKPFRFKARAWELMQRAGVAPHDCAGSNLFLHTRGGRVMRVVPRENEAVNETWLSDRDRYSYQGIYAGDRLERPAVKVKGKWQDADWDVALETAAAGLRAVVEAHGPAELGALLSPAATLEEHYLTQRLMRGLGSGNIDHRLRQVDFGDADNDPLFPGLNLSFAELEGRDAFLVVGSHLRKEVPILNHRLRKAVQGGARAMFLNPARYDFNYDTVVNLGINTADWSANLAGVARALDKDLPAGPLGELIAAAEVTDDHRAMAEGLETAERPLILLGAMALAHPQFTTLRALAGFIARATGGVRGYLPPANGVGAHLAGALPLRDAGGAAATVAGLDAAAMLERGLKGFVTVAVEPAADCWDGRLAARRLQEAEFTVCLSAYRTPELEALADVLLPIGVFAETAGTHVNAVGLWQRFEGAARPVGEARPAWKVLRVLANRLELPGFDYTECGQIHDEVRKRVDDQPVRAGDALGEPGGGEDGALTLGRIPEPAIYGTDAVVRRAGALQDTLDGRSARESVYLHPADAERLGLSEGDPARLTMDGGAGAVTLTARLDPRLAAGGVLVYMGSTAAGLAGPAFGEVSLDRG